MSTARAEVEPVADDIDIEEASERRLSPVLTPDEEAALLVRLAKVDASEKTGRLVPWDVVRAARGI